MDEFSDDDFGDFDDSLLDQLENNALQLTQAKKVVVARPEPLQPPPTAPRRPVHPPPRPSARPPPNPYGYGFEDDDFDDTEVVDSRYLQPPQPTVGAARPAQPPARPGIGLAGQQQWNKQQGPAYTPRQQFQTPSRPQTSYPQRPVPVPSQRLHGGVLPQRPAPTQSQFARPAPPVTRPYPAQPSQAPHNAHNAVPGHNILATLQDRISALETELTASKGEAAILRSKYEKTNTALDDEIAHLKRQITENAAKHEQAIQAAVAAGRTTATELEFARQDLREGLGRAKPRRKDGSTTPRKSKSWGMADGFDDLEMTGSPSKLQAQKRKDAGSAIAAQGDRTPSKGKRKRPAVDSPTFALEIDSGDGAIAAGALPSAKAGRPHFLDGQRNVQLDFLKFALDHAYDFDQPLTFDLFAGFSYPSDPAGRSFASYIFEKIPSMGNSREPYSLLVDFAELLIEMWQQCLAEKYHFPLFYMGVLLESTMKLNAGYVAPRIISSLIPVCTTTCRLVALPRFNSVDGDISDHPDYRIRQLSIDFTIPQTMALLNLAAAGCLAPPVLDAKNPNKQSHQVEFWRTVDMEFVIIMLSTKQPRRWYFGILQLLYTSALPTSLGPVPSPISETSYEQDNPGSPELIASAIIDRVSLGLVETPRWAPAGSCIGARVKIAVLDLLIFFASSPFCFSQIARSDVAIQRLVTTLCWAVEQLYDVDMSLPVEKYQTDAVSPADESTCMDIDDDEPAPLLGFFLEPIERPSDPDFLPHTSSLLCRIVSKTVLLLHALVTDPRTANVMDMNKQLATCSGGSQRYLLTLTRLNFAEEDLVLERDVDAETAERAHDLLEMAVTPDEGEEIRGLFGPEI